MNEYLSNEHHIYGPPGCGKTAELIKRADTACVEYGDNYVRVVSFTKAAAENVRSRLDHFRPTVSTLHSACYGMVGKPVIAETQIDEFNKGCPEFALPKTINPGYEAHPDDDHVPNTRGSRCYALRELCIATCKPKSDWKPEVVEFDAKWNAFKQSNDLMDFADLLTVAMDNYDTFVGTPDVVFVDEAQDLSRLEVKLIRKFCGGGNTERYILALDDDQTIYGFKGASPEEVLIEVGGKEYLEQSWRLPSAVQSRAERLIQRVSRRQPKAFSPRDCVGEVRRCPATYKQPELMLRSLNSHLEQGKKVMILVSCSYMLVNILKVMAQHGIPFWNQLRPHRFEWNPLHPRGERVSDADRIRAFLRPDATTYGSDAKPWRGSDLAKFAEALDPSVFTGPLEAISGLPGDQLLSEEQLSGIFAGDHLAQALSREPLDWFRRNMTREDRNRLTMRYALAICDKRGKQALRKDPQVIIGTIHSVKGAEADVVYLFPDLSTSGRNSWTGSRNGRDSVIRLMYVGMTRARESLVLCDAHNGRYAVDCL